jgi:selenocysteine-specific elongation factor
MYVIGTAGHVDHGKSTLVKALTGIHPDRLKEEIDREMTIDLGFAWLTLPSGDPVGIVDMPGHRDFIENMLAGVGGIDAVLLVIAADEGVMPQTREHLAIIDLLQVKKGIIVLTKTDLVKDSEWLNLVKEDIRSLVKGTILESALILSVSSVTGEGIEELKKNLFDLLKEGTPRMDMGRPRLPIDRVFTMTGFGTVVTGTLLDGGLEVGQEVVILPVGSAARIRGLQSYKTKHTRVGPGNRVAVNLSGININQIKRGEVLTLPGKYIPTNIIYAHVRILKDASAPARSNKEIKIYLGAAEILARMKILGTKEINPGEKGWVKLESSEPMVAVKRDRFILRRPSPAETIGGGEVVEEHPGKAFDSRRKSIIESLEVAYKGQPDEILGQVLLQKGSLTLDDLQKETHLSANDTVKVVDQMIQDGKAQIMRGEGGHLSGSTLIIHSDTWNLLLGKMSEVLRNFHEKNPLKRGMLKEEVRSRLIMDARFFQTIVTKMVSDGKLVEDAAYLHLPDFIIRYTPEQNADIRNLQTLFNKNPFSPPTIAECIGLVGEEVFNVLVDNEIFLRISQDVVFDPKNLKKLHQIVLKYFETHPTLSVAEFRDLVGTSRKYALAVLEYLDEKGVTVRNGESRVLITNPPC